MATIRTLFVTLRLPSEAGGGTGLRGLQVLHALDRAGPVAVFGLARGVAGAASPWPVAEWRTSSDATLADEAGAESLSWLREPDGHPADRWLSPVAVGELVRLAEEFVPDAVVVDQLWLHRYIAPLAELGVPLVLNTHNVEASVQDEIAARGGRSPLVAALCARTRAIESAAVRTVDQVWVCSERDRDALRGAYPDCAPVSVVRNAIDVSAYTAACGSTLLFPGTFNYPPNARAASFILDELLPLLGDVRVVLAGRAPTAAMRAVRDPRVVVPGAVDDMRPYLVDAEAMVVPLAEGGGTRFKVLEAFAARLPVVSTRKGVEGLAVADGEHVLLAETPAEFAAQLERLRADDALRSRLSERAHALVREQYSWDAADADVAAALAQL